MKSSFKYRLLKWFITVSVIPSILIGSFSYYIIVNEIKKDTEQLITSINEGIYNMIDTQQRVLNQWLLSAADSFEKKLAYLGDNYFNEEEMVDVGKYKVPTWYIGDQRITLDYILVDELIGTERLPASIFMLVDNEFLRVSTNVRQADGSRIVGTTLSKEGPVYERLINGQAYLGRANVEGIMHATIYVPIFDKEKRMIGAYVLGRKEQEYELINAIRRIRIGDDGYVMIMDTKGDAIIHPKLTGSNLIEYDWVKQIINSKKGYVEYNYEDEDKIAYYMYYEPWDWYIVSIGLNNDIYATSRTLLNTLVLIIVVSLCISLILGIVISKEFFKPINEMMEALKKLKKGDLSSKFTSYGDEEFKFLSNSFNAMSYTLSILIGRIKLTSNKLKMSSGRLLDDFNRSKNALDNIEKTIAKSIESVNGFESYENQIHVINDGKSLKEDIRSIKNLLPNLVSPDDSHIIELIDKVSDIDYRINHLEGVYQDRFGVKEFNTLYIEVQKMKLLLENIHQSASALDEIASEIDSQSNIFQTENNPYED
ncbi:MAG: methyl-accepting chemotaxis protein [Dethiosulfatibacter sp.]|nr:methyl-accepting chemotaxis protein [Dethiosulfatibacter sp.]